MRHVFLLEASRRDNRAMKAINPWARDHSRPRPPSLPLHAGRGLRRSLTRLPTEDVSREQPPSGVRQFATPSGTRVSDLGYTDHESSRHCNQSFIATTGEPASRGRCQHIAHAQGTPPRPSSAQASAIRHVTHAHAHVVCAARRCARCGRDATSCTPCLHRTHALVASTRSSW